MDAGGYDPFEAGPQVVATASFEAKDAARDRLFPCEVWHPQASGQHPLVVFSHYSGGSRTASSFLCWHLASHGYVVAAMDHSEVVAPELAARQGETSGERLARVNAIIASRVPDVRFLIDYLLGGSERAIDGVAIDETLIGLVGHSFGGWTALATPDVESVGERTPATKRMFMLRRADHQHFVDDVEASHEALRAMTLPGAAAWIPAAMLPISELCSGAQAHLFARGLTLSHLDAALRRSEAAERFLGSDVQAELAARAVDAVEYAVLEYPGITEG